MNLYSIDCKKYKLNGLQNMFGEEKVLETDNNEIHATFFIECDNEQDNFSYKTEYYGDGELTVDDNRCDLEVYIKENKTPYDKHFTIKCTHVNDENVSIVIEIIQKAEEFKLEITSGASSIGTNRYEKVLKSEITSVAQGKSDNNFNYYEEVQFAMNVVGGSRKYRIESIVKCHKDEEDTEEISYRKFDGGFIYNKFDDKLIITNYGRPFLNQNDFYLIKMRHEDYRELSIELILRYSEPSVLWTTVAKTKKRGRKKKLRPQISDIYLPYETIMKAQQNNEILSKKENIVEIRLLEDIGDELIIENKENATSLPFEVLENGQPSNLMVKVYSSGTWCNVRTDITNRNLMVIINNMPVGERKSFVKVSVIDYPEVFFTFIIKNIKR